MRSNLPPATAAHAFVCASTGPGRGRGVVYVARRVDAGRDVTAGRAGADAAGVEAILAWVVGGRVRAHVGEVTSALLLGEMTGC